VAPEEEAELVPESVLNATDQPEIETETEAEVTETTTLEAETETTEAETEESMTTEGSVSGQISPMEQFPLFLNMVLLRLDETQKEGEATFNRLTRYMRLTDFSDVLPAAKGD
jgi:hypothetical protein